ncbi:hypothetical protein F2Q69_00032730 [Brassica cretica]|uniref:Transmembrane protein n=1 Tax=Brassica cretica TaxID=69181 RepID=A0A8S9SM77_BRACR|nr:hypothetical protein F2Q69_00032730 [Brassica cretica]
MSRLRRDPSLTLIEIHRRSVGIHRRSVVVSVEIRRHSLSHSRQREITRITLSSVAAPLMEKLPWINHFHNTPDREWFETDAVLRVSLGNFVFFSILLVMMIGVKTQKDPRDGIHHGGWMMKVI